jgi:hypothetical protein
MIMNTVRHFFSALHQKPFKPLRAIDGNMNPFSKSPTLSQLPLETISLKNQPTQDTLKMRLPYTGIPHEVGQRMFTQQQRNFQKLIGNTVLFFGLVGFNAASAQEAIAKKWPTLVWSGVTVGTLFKRARNTLAYQNELEAVDVFLMKGSKNTLYETPIAQVAKQGYRLSRKNTEDESSTKWKAFIRRRLNEGYIQQAEALPPLPDRWEL